MKRFVLGMAVVAGLILALGAGFGGADPGTNGLTHADGHGHWFRQVCDTASGTTAGCDADVVSDSSGTPLAGGGPVGGYGPAQLVGAYALPNAPQGSNPHPIVGIVDAYDDPNAASDLNAFSTQYGLPLCNTGNPCFTKVNQSGGTSYPASNSGWDLEISLDIETVHALCPACYIDLVEASSASITNLGLAENEAAKLGAVAISNSWGSSESAAETSWDTAYFDHPGTAITASTGDNGYAGGTSWPASSQFVTGVGGTSLTVNNDNTYGGETVWSGGGSGCSADEAQPSWQVGLGSCTNRSVADVAADADPNTGESVYDSVSYQGQVGWFQVGGTSLASPIIATVYALAGGTSSITNGSTPYAYAGQSNLLHDVTSGNNGTCTMTYICTAGTGYDGPTGVGTPNGVGAFSPVPPSPDYSLSVGAQTGTITNGTGGNSTFVVTVHDLNNFSDAVTLTTGSLPNGISSLGFSPSSTSSPATLTVAVASGVAAGNYNIPITGMADGKSHTVNATLTVASPPPPGFSVSISPSPQTIGPSASTTYTVTIGAVNGFDGMVTFSVSGLPRNVSGAFSPTSITGAGTTTLTVTSRNARRSNGSFTVTATSGGVKHTATATLAVT